jgi:hypothetical protein
MHREVMTAPTNANNDPALQHPQQPTRVPHRPQTSSRRSPLAFRTASPSSSPLAFGAYKEPQAASTRERCLELSFDTLRARGDLEHAQELIGWVIAWKGADGQARGVREGVLYRMLVCMCELGDFASVERIVEWIGGDGSQDDR